ncbi:MAG: folylpolyglutamate synthase [Chitinophagales bacterium]|nr:MAG: folylpolyglutamate synthase [Chitinophagales bacterium]
MTYQEALHHLYDQLPMFQRIGAAAFKKDLTNTLFLCAMLKEPHQRFKSIHVAGTNGKGSVSHLLAAMLQAQGYKTGLYISPHYKDFRERIKINGDYISAEQVVRFVERYRSEYEKIKPSFFEITVAMAFDYFAAEQVDIAVIETGMGGRLDSTNVITPLLSVITNIGYDHMQFLGNTLPAIAFEKAGIIKPHVPVVIGETDAETAPVFQEVASERNAPIEFADQHVQVMLKSKSHGGMRVDIAEHQKVVYTDVFTSLYGGYQLKNIATAWHAARMLQKAASSFLPLSERAMLEGIEKVRALTRLQGRWDFLSVEGPVIICDSGHNAHGIREVVRELMEMTCRHLHFVIGFVKDKDLQLVLPLFPSGERYHYYFCRPDLPRGLDAEELQKQAWTFGLNGRAYPSVRAALESAKQLADKQDVIFVGGSTFVVAEVI